MEIPVSPIVLPRAEAENSDRYLILDGSPFPEDRVIPDDIMAALQPMLISTPEPIEEKYPVDGTSVPFCKIISSPVTINPVDGTVAVPNHAFRDDMNFPDPSTQFLSEVTGTQQFFIGILLGDNVPPLTLDGVDITVRVPSDGLGEFAFSAGQHLNMVPVPKSYQIFGTMDILSEGQNPDDLHWSPITPVMTAEPARWSFATPTKHRLNHSDDESHVREKYRGFKLVVFDWDDTNAQPGDMGRGISRLKFIFNPEELVELRKPSATYLPDLPVDEDTVVAFDLLGTLVDGLTNVLADAPQTSSSDEHVADALAEVHEQIGGLEERQSGTDNAIAELAAKVSELDAAHNSNSAAWADFSRDTGSDLRELSAKIGELEQQEKLNTAIAEVKADLLKTLDSELDSLVVSPAIICPSDQKYLLSELYKQHGHALDKIMAVSGEGTTILVLSDNPSDADTLTVENYRVDGGKVQLISPNHKIHIIYEKKIIGVYNQVTLTDPGESITLMFYNDQWIGKISS